MRCLIMTGNAVRHKYIANALKAMTKELMVICECNPLPGNPGLSGRVVTSIERHFICRDQTERAMLGANDFFLSDSLPILYKEINAEYVNEVVRSYAPEIVLVYGASILSPKLIEILPKGRTINLHLGLSPYYRGSGTNFWPLVNNEPGYIGATLLHLDSGIDTGDIIGHIRPVIESGDNVHTIGCKVLIKAAEGIQTIISRLEAGKELNRVKQWEVANQRYYRNSDFSELILEQYEMNMKNGMVEDYLSNPKERIRLIDLTE